MSVVNEYLQQLVHQRSEIGNNHARSSETVAQLSLIAEDYWAQSGAGRVQAEARAEEIMAEHAKLAEHVMAIENGLNDITEMVIRSARAYHESRARTEKARIQV